MERAVNRVVPEVPVEPRAPEPAPRSPLQLKLDQVIAANVLIEQMKMVDILLALLDQDQTIFLAATPPAGAVVSLPFEKHTASRLLGVLKQRYLRQLAEMGVS